MLAKKNLNRLLSSLLAVIMLLGLLPTAAFASAEETQAQKQIVNEGGTYWYDAAGNRHDTAPDEWVTKITKKLSATGVENDFQVDLSVETKDQIKQTTSQEADSVDVVLVLDRSGSMSGNRMSSAKKAACDFVYSFLDNNDAGKRRVGLVSYAGSSESNSELTTSKTDLAGTKYKGDYYYGKINGLYAYGGTNIQAGLHTAGELLKNSTASYKFIVLLSDGEPTYSVEVEEEAKKTPVDQSNFEKVGDGKKAYQQNYVYATSEFDYGRRDGDGDDTSKELAYNTVSEAYALKNSGITIYGVGISLENSNSAKYTMYNSVTSPRSEYYMNADSTSNLGETLSRYFTNISENITIMTNAWKLTDTMGASMDFMGFKDGDKGATQKDGTISWSLRNPAASGTEQGSGNWLYTLSYKVRLDTTDPDYIANYAEHQTVPANESATVTYTTDDMKDADGKLVLKTATFAVPTIKGYLGTLSFDKQAYGKPLAGMVFTLTHATDCACGISTSWSKNGVSDKDGKVEVTGVPSGHTYTLTESKTDEYGVAGPYAVKVAYGDIDANGTDIPNASGKYIVTNTRLEGTKSVSFTKNWTLPGNETRPDSISVIVERRANGSTDDSAWAQFGELRTINTTDAGIYTIDTLPKYNTADGVEWQYRVREANVADGIVTIGNDKYEVSYSDNNTITNKLVGTASVSFTKDWDGEANDKHAGLSITVLLKDGETEVNRMTVPSPWSGTFTTDKNGNPLPKYRNGSAINYTIEEAKLDNYASNVTKNGDGTFTIKNTRNNEDITISGTKSWVDYNNAYDKRPNSVTIELYRNGDKINDTIATAADNWEYAFSADEDGNLLKLKDAQGDAYTYTVAEPEVEGYTSQVNGYDITNTVTDIGEMLTSVSVHKEWVVPDDIELPESVTVTLLRGLGDNKPSATEQTATLNESNGWEHSFEKLPLLDKNTGKAYTYDVQETVPGGYEQTDKTGSAADGFVITNTYQTTDDDTVSVSATKLWKDEGDTSGRQTVTVKVLENTKGMVGTLTLSADTWSDSITLPKYKLVTPDATEEDPNPESHYEDCVYTLEEITVLGYKQGVITGSMEDGFIVTNTILPGERTLKVTKQWNDPSGSVKQAVVFDVKIVNADNTLTDTSDSITVASGSTTGSVTVPKFDSEGKTIRYTLVERSVGGFSAGTLIGSMEEGFAITNSINQSYTQISGTKDWQGVPADTDETTLSATVYLERSENNGSTWARMEGDAYTKALTSADWTYAWTDLPVYNDSRTAQYSYRVREEAVDGYYTTYTGNNITNTYNLTSVSATKLWNDPKTEAVRAGRPGVTFELYANGEKLSDKSYSLTAEELLQDRFDYTFENLSIKDSNGDPITYTVQEVMAEGSNYLSTPADNGTFVFTNTIKNPETSDRSFRVTKAWENMEATLPDGSKPAQPTSIWVQLYKGDPTENNGVAVGDKVKLTAKDGWAHNFGELTTYNSDGSYCSYYAREVVEVTDESGTKIWTPITERVTIGGDTYTVAYQQNNNADGAAASTAITNTYTAPTLYFYQVVRHYVATVDGVKTVDESATDPVVRVAADGERNITIDGDQQSYKSYTSAAGSTYGYSFDATATGTQNTVALEETNHLYTVNLYYVYSYTTPVTPPPSGGDDTYYTVTVNYLEQDTQKVLRSAYSERKSEGNRYDVTNRDAITITGYSYVETTGDALSGNLNGNKVINVWYTPESEIVEPDTPLNPSPEPTPDVEIPEETTPLNPVPELPGTETGTEIEEPEVPLGKLPQTGFVATPVEPSMTIGLLAVAFSLVGAGLHLTFGRKKAEEEE